MRIDTDPTTPQTPEQQSAVEPPEEPPSSRITTINLRNTVQLGDRTSSPVSPTKRGIASQPGDSPDDVKISVEGPEAVGMAAAPIRIIDTPQSSPSNTGSPVEVVAVSDDDDMVFGSGEPEVAIIGEDNMFMDPMADFPYNDGHSETYAETVGRLVNYFTTRRCFLDSFHCCKLTTTESSLEETVFQNLRDWVDQYLRHAQHVPYGPAISSYEANRQLWTALPDLIWTLINRKWVVSRRVLTALKADTN
jgi:ubiquitin carboxyl-terminal hydrolase 34